MSTSPSDKKRPKLFAAGLLVIAAISLALILFNNWNDDLAIKPDDPATIKLGQSLYKANCASCHGQNLEGQPDWQSANEDGRMPAPPHDKTGHTWHHANELLFELTKFSVTKFAGADYETDMPAYEDVLSDKEISAVLSFIINSWPEDIRLNHDRINESYVKK